jgi:phage gp29-like protein
MATTDDIPARPTRATLGEIATTQDGMDVTRYTGGQLLYPTDELLRQRGSGLDLTIYKQVLSDPKCRSAFGERQSAVTSSEWAVEPASERRIDKRAAEYVTQQLRRVGLDRITSLMLYSIWYGYGVAEWIYEIRDGLVGLDMCRVRDRRRFRFAPDGSLRMLTRSRMAEGIAVDPGKFWVLSVGADHDDEPYGTGLGHWAYWPVLFKRQGLARWLTFLDRFAQPLAIGTYDSKLDDESGTQRARLLAALRALRTDSGIALPEGMAITLLEASRSGTPDYESMYRLMDQVLSQVIVGQTMTSESGSSMAQANVHLTVRGEIVKADADLICESLNRTVVTWLTRWNFAGADPPRLYRKLDPPSDLDKQSERDERLSRIGYRPTLMQVQADYGGEWEPMPNATASTHVATSLHLDGAASVAFADGDTPPPSIAETLADKLARESEPAWREIVDVIEARVQAATSLPALRDELLSMWPELPRERLAAAMGAAMAAAEVIGQLDVIEESEGTANGG